jgi:uncharacterized damage-inducible protein DinB
VDRWLFERLAGNRIPAIEPSPGAADGLDWDTAIGEFQQLGLRREQCILRFTHEDLATVRFKGAHGDEGLSLWELLCRRSLDHEIHHRGELQLMLMLRYGPEAPGWA